MKLCSSFGLPDILHSDQGANFESTILWNTLEEFGVVKTRTTAYHPQGDGMVERLNRSLLQLLRTYVSKEEDWEPYLPLALYAYRTGIHASTRMSPFMLMFGRQPQPPAFPHSHAFDPSSYQAHLRAKLAELQDLVDTNTAEAAQRQAQGFDNHSSDLRQFKQGDPVWLSIPNAGKLRPRWEGGWKIGAAL